VYIKYIMEKKMVNEATLETVDISYDAISMRQLIKYYENNRWDETKTGVFMIYDDNTFITCISSWELEAINNDDELEYYIRFLAIVKSICEKGLVQGIFDNFWNVSCILAETPKKNERYQKFYLSYRDISVIERNKQIIEVLELLKNQGGSGLTYIM